MEYVEAKITVSEIALKEADIKAREAVIDETVDKSSVSEERKEAIRSNLKEGI